MIIYVIFISAGSWLNAGMKKDDQPLLGKYMYSSFVSAQKKEQSGVLGELTSMKKKYIHSHAFVCAHANTQSIYLLMNKFL